MSAALAGLMIP